MNKKYLGGIAIFIVTAVAAFNMNFGANQKNDMSLFALANAEALAEESGASADELTCYSTYNNCWFWNCSTIYRCNANECYDVSADAWSDKGICKKKN